jgi:hypothetical protein
VQQDFWVEMDTSTSDLFIPHASCTSCADKFRYNSDASRTSEPLGVPFSIEKYHSVASGDLYKDNITIAHNFAIAQQTFGAVRPSAPFS